jgi:hypothetical protein
MAESSGTTDLFPDRICQDFMYAGSYKNQRCVGVYGSSEIQPAFIHEEIGTTSSGIIFSLKSSYIF